MSESYQFDASFERKLLAFLIRDIKFFYRNSGYVREVYFASRDHKDIWIRSKKYIETYAKPITEIDLRNEITAMYYERQKQDVPIDAYFDVITDLFKVDLISEEYTDDLLRKFAQNKEMESALNKGLDLVDHNKELAPILQDVTKVLMIGHKLEHGYDYFDMAQERFTRSFDIEKETKVSTGIKKLDFHLRGGLALGEIGIVAAPWNRGKTALLINFSYGAMKRGKNVIYINLEGKIADIATRFDMLINQTDKDSLKLEQVRVEDSSEQNRYFVFVNHVGKLLKSRLILRGFPADTVTVADIEQYILHEQLISQVEFDLIVIDYLNKCRKSNPKDDSWMGASYREGQGLAGKLNKPVWSAAQIKADEKLRYDVHSPNHIAESTNRIASDMDVIIHVLCKKDEEEKPTDPITMKLFIGKNRNNPARREVPILFHRNKMLIEEMIVTGQPQEETTCSDTSCTTHTQG